jgi:fumarate reductase flavoprotein subunit
MGDGDCPDVHFSDTVKGSDWGCDQEVARLFAETAPIAVREMAHWGLPWNRVVPGKSTYYKAGKQYEKIEPQEREGLITARDFGGTAKWRTCYTSDGTGHTLLFTMDNVVVQLGVTVHDRVEALSLIHDGGTCMGAVARCLKTGRLRVYLAKATLIATGGYGRLYRETTNAVINDGSGAILALDTGIVPLGNMEAVQFHPTGIVPTNILVTEGCRGDGGTLKDVNEERFMHIYEPGKQELASRDVVSRWMTHHIREGKGVKSPYGDHLWLDIRHLGERHIKTKLREVEEICNKFLGIDPITQMIPVRPAQHYSMGGVRTDKDGAAYGLKGLFAAGEAACWDMHGFNRLGGNSLAETIVAGRIIGQKVADFLEGYEVAFKTDSITAAFKKDEARLERLIRSRDGRENVFALRREMQDTLMDRVANHPGPGPTARTQVERRGGRSGVGPGRPFSEHGPSGLMRGLRGLGTNGIPRLSFPGRLSRAQRPGLAQTDPGHLASRRSFADPGLRAQFPGLGDPARRAGLRRLQDHLLRGSLGLRLAAPGGGGAAGDE